MSVRENHGMVCPKCKRDDNLKVAVRTWVLLLPQGVENEGADHTWDWNNEVMCEHEDCQWDGTAGDCYNACEALAGSRA